MAGFAFFEYFLAFLQVGGIGHVEGKGQGEGGDGHRQTKLPHLNLLTALTA
jgi:hypothetical protein